LFFFLFAFELGVSNPLVFNFLVPALEADMKEGTTIGYIYCGATPAGIFCLSDACRSGVAVAIRELKLLGIKTAMLTGDRQAAAMHVQEQVHFLALFHIIFVWL
jgi:P-type E1-E2 ATPase